MGSKRKCEVPSRHTVLSFDEGAPSGREAVLGQRGARRR